MGNEIVKKIVARNMGGHKDVKITKLSGGLLHEVLLLETNDQSKVLKLLNQEIMQRDGVFVNFQKADYLEEILVENNISLVPSLKFNSKKMQEIDGRYYYLYEYINGTYKQSKDLNENDVEKIAKILANIHSIKVNDNAEFTSEKNIPKYQWGKYIDVIKEKNNDLYLKYISIIEYLSKVENEIAAASLDIPEINTICHNDLHVKNVLWENDKPLIIDLETLSLNNPYIEIFETALYWSGFDEQSIDYNNLSLFIKHYRDNSSIRWIDFQIIANYISGRFDWLEYNIKRAFILDVDEKEKEIGFKEIGETIDKIIYFEKQKTSIVKVFNDGEC
ncbi:aminoglycoside phosphotransferase family protein [[Acholeplasma] multilocale]|uniref:aminoglycoside phosphotransferase family protein n=1 Tax=[Acholeplasma] multilocale TaxID=264638 RepID=UPI00047CD788|nr:aminoglycoside phosphotransferase family protein [[Acholeplasma] multilocale]